MCLYFIVAVCTKKASLLVSSGEKILHLSLTRACPKYLAYLRGSVHSKTLLKTIEQRFREHLTQYTV